MGQTPAPHASGDGPAATAPASNSEMPAGTLRGVTVDSGGFSLAAVTVIVRSATGAEQRLVSDADGVFRADHLPPGAYAISVSRDGYSSPPESVVQVVQGRTVNASVQLAVALGSLRGVTLAAGGFSLGGANVVIHSVSGAGLDRRLVSDADGVFKLDDLQPGKYEITASKDGFLSAPPTPVEISGKKTVNASVAMVAAPNPTAAMVAPPANPGAMPAGAAAPVAAPPQQAAAPAPASTTPEALQSPASAPAADQFTPFAYADFTWMNGTSRNKDTVLDTKFFTPEIRFDTNYIEDFNQPKDHTIVGATESFRSGEVQIEQASVGGDFHWQNVRGRILFMFGMFATTTPRNDASFGVGQWNLRGAYKYTSEAWGGYHFNVNHGLNVDAGIFVSYIGLFSYYNFDNWTYQPSYVSSNTPWFFNGVRVQWFPTNKLKIEPWFINGWQSYAKYNGHPGLGGQLLWQPKEWFKLVANQYGFGQDNLGLPHTERIHTDDSIEVRYFNRPDGMGLDKMAFSLTGDAGCQYGGGIQCTGAPSKNKDSFLGWMAYDRFWFHKDLLALTFGGGKMSNYGRYLTLLPPINGADAVTGSPYFPELPGQKAHMWDSTVNLQYMPREYITWWTEVGYRHSDIPYFAGRGGVTPPGFPLGGTNGQPGQYACMSGAASGFADLPDATSACSGQGGVWFPDLRHSEAKWSAGVMVKF
ncbi:MAG TPA: TonB-dependent receptor [Bryobacteraceae bacterium]|nr:TonB-dependent receptor [Bryobacteraceae bacterium]